MMVLEQELLAQQIASPAIVEMVVTELFPGGVISMQYLTTAEAPVSETVTWPCPVGVDTVEVTAGALTIGASTQAERTLSSLSISKSGRHHILNFGQTVRLVALTFSGFTYRPEGATEDLPFSPSSSARLVIAVPNPQTEWLPIYAIPSIGRASTPKLYAGASMNGNTVHLPRDIQPVSRVRVSVVENFAGEGERVLTSTITNASARIKNLPDDLTVTNESEATTIFQQDGLYLDDSPPTTLNLVNHGQATFEKQLAAQEPLRFQWRAAAKTGTAFGYAVQPLQGVLRRTFPGVTRVTVHGEPQRLPLDLSSGPLDAETPSLVTADLTVTYDGLRLLVPLNDALPPAAGNIRGHIVGTEPVSRIVLHEEIASYPVARIGLIGRAPVACELSVWLSTTQDGEPLTDPGVVQLPASTDLRLFWVELPQAITHTGPLAIQVRANSGRFFWVADPEPLLKLAVRDPLPNQRPVLMQGRLLVELSEPRLHYPQIALAADLFTHQPPVLSSELFVTVELTDVTLHYAR